VCQAILISHHPRLLNFLARDAGVWLSRDDGVGPTRVKPLAGTEDESGLAVSQLIERGWMVNTT